MEYNWSWKELELKNVIPQNIDYQTILKCVGLPTAIISSIWLYRKAVNKNDKKRYFFNFEPFKKIYIQYSLTNMDAEKPVCISVVLFSVKEFCNTYG